MVPGRDETTTDSVGQGDRLSEVVGHEDDGRLGVGPQPEQLLVEHELQLGVQDGAPGEERVGLGDVPDLGVVRRHRLTVVEHRATGGLHQSGGEVEQRRLPTSLGSTTLTNSPG
jgi:hypothetical protein